MVNQVIPMMVLEAALVVDALSPQHWYSVHKEYPNDGPFSLLGGQHLVNKLQKTPPCLS